MTDSLLPPPDPRFQDALEALYREFAAPVPRIIEGCPCCLEKRGTDVLLATPLRDLTGQMLWSYVSGLFYTVGSERDFRYFLPRILEVASIDPGNSNGAEIVLTKLSLANWHAWRPEEQAVVTDFVDAWFEAALARDLAEADEGWIGSEAESVLCGAARAGLALVPWLMRLQQPDAAPVLEDMKARFPERPSGFWEDAPEGFEALTAILR